MLCFSKFLKTDMPLLMPTTAVLLKITLTWTDPETRAHGVQNIGLSGSWKPVLLFVASETADEGIFFTVEGVTERCWPAANKMKVDPSAHKSVYKLFMSNDGECVKLRFYITKSTAQLRYSITKMKISIKYNSSDFSKNGTFPFKSFQGVRHLLS